MGFQNFFRLDTTAWFLYQATDAVTDEPIAADALPTFRVFGSSGLMTNGTGTATAFDSPTSTGLYKVSFSASTANGYERGQHYTIRVLAVIDGDDRVDESTIVVT